MNIKHVKLVIFIKYMEFVVEYYTGKLEDYTELIEATLNGFKGINLRMSTFSKLYDLLDHHLSECVITDALEEVMNKSFKAIVVLLADAHNLYLIGYKDIRSFSEFIETVYKDDVANVVGEMLIKVFLKKRMDFNVMTEVIRMVDHEDIERCGYLMDEEEEQ